MKRKKNVQVDTDEFDSIAENIFPLWLFTKQKTASSRSPTRASNCRVVSERLRGCSLACDQVQLRQIQRDSRRPQTNYEQKQSE